MKKAALVAALAQILWSLLIVAPQVFGFTQMLGLDWIGKGLMLFQSVAVAIFFFSVYWKQEQLASSSQMRRTALIAGLCLAIENLLPTYRTILGVVFSSKDVFAWKYHPFFQMRYVLAPTIPTITIISVIAFLIVVYVTSSRSRQLPDSGTGAHGHTGVRNAALLAFIASIAALGQLLYVVASYPIRQMPVFAIGLAMRLLSLGSLALFFLLFRAAQASESHDPT